MGPIGSPETSARNYHYSLRNNPAKCSSPFSLALRKCRDYLSIYLFRLFFYLQRTN